MILEWTLYLKEQALNVVEFVITSMKAQKIWFLSDMMKDGIDEDGGWRGGGLGQAVSTMETFLEVSVAGVDRWDRQVDSGIVLAAFGCWVLVAFGGEELLADLLSVFSIWLALVYAMMILNLSMQTTGTPGGGGERTCKGTT